MKYLSLWPVERSLRSQPSFDLFQNFDRFFDDFNESGRNFQPALDVEESVKGYLVTLDVPGIKKEDIKIELRGQNLVISGERKKESSSDTNGIRYERSYGSFLRTLELPRTANLNEIEAEYDSGVLKLTIPKTQEAQARFINIK